VNFSCFNHCHCVPPLMQAEQRKNKHDDDDQTDEINYSVHDFLHTTDERVLNG